MRGLACVHNVSCFVRGRLEYGDLDVAYGYVTHQFLHKGFTIVLLLLNYGNAVFAATPHSSI